LKILHFNKERQKKIFPLVVLMFLSRFKFHHF